MNQTFQYSVLRYRPSYLLDERVNIGLLFQFTDTIDRENVTIAKNTFVFIFPSKLQRVSNFFPNLGKANLNDLKQYLRSFQRIAQKLSNVSALEATSLTDIIPNEFIVNDTNGFFFSEIKEGCYQSVKDTIRYYEAQYFKYYDQSKSVKSKDIQVKESFQKTLFSLTDKNDIRLNYFKEGFNIQNKITTSKFEYRWQNGTTNLIKTLGFDLSDKQDIQDKAFKWSASINYIHKIAAYQDYHFDILVSRPNRPALFQAYDKALEVLSDINPNKAIIEEEDFKNYAQKALDTIKNSEE